jgi:hypothetical protein
MIPLPNRVWRHLHVQLFHLPMPLMMILLPNRVWWHLRVRVFRTPMPNPQIIVFPMQILTRNRFPTLIHYLQFDIRSLPVPIVAFNRDAFPGLFDNCPSSIKRQPLYRWFVVKTFESKPNLLSSSSVAPW